MNKYKFQQFQTALTAFIGNLRKKVNSFYEFTSKYGEIPVMLLETGDETYNLLNKFQNEQKEIYLKVPRIVIGIEDFTIENDQDTNRATIINYILPTNNTNELWNGSFRRRAISIPITLNIVTSNYISALEFSELALIILTKENITTYNWLGNDYPLDYQMNNISIERNTMDMGNSKNVVVKVNIDLKLAIQLPRYETLEKIGETLSHTGNEGRLLDDYGNNVNDKDKNNNNNNDNNNNDGTNTDSGRDLTGFTPVFKIESQMCDKNTGIPYEKEKKIILENGYVVPETYPDELRLDIDKE